MNPAIIGESKNFLSNGFLFETAAQSEISLLEEKYQDKINSWMEKIRKKTGDILGKMIIFLKHVTRKIFDNKKILEMVIKKLNDTKFTEKDYSAITSIVESAIKNSGAPISDKQPEGYNKLPRGVVLMNNGSIKVKLAAALVNTQIHTVVSGERFKMALSERQITQFFDEISAMLPTANFENAIKMLERFKADNLSNGVLITNDPSTLSKLIESLEKIKNDIVEKINKTNSNTPEYGTGQSKLFNDVVLVAGNSLALYGSVHKYRFLVIADLARLFQKPVESEADN